MAKNLTITVDDEVLRWTRFCAAKAGMSVSKFVRQVIEHERTGKGHPYRLSYEDWKELSRKGLDIDAENRLRRREARDRKR